MLDLVSPGVIPVRFASIGKQISVDLQIPLSLKYTKNERPILVKVIETTSLYDIEVIVKDIPQVPMLVFNHISTLFYQNCRLSRLYSA